MTAHSSGSGSSWNETLDVDQPHGLDYQEWNDIRIGIRKRMAQEHASFADSTVGGIHAPGETAIMGMEDGTPANTTSRGRGIVWDTSSRLWCNTSTAGVSTAYSPCVLSIHPDKQWGGGDVTWVGAHEFDSSVDISGNTTIEGALSVDNSSDFSDVFIEGDLTLAGKFVIDGSADFSDVYVEGDLSVDGVLKVDGTASEFGETAGIGLFYDPTDYANAASKESSTLGNGMIIKCGNHTHAADITTVTFGTAFPNGVVSVTLTGDDTVTLNANCRVHEFSTSFMEIYNDRGTSGVGTYWTAIGY
jgi:cytoskeletal protein CcmA (bactofilin family)